jgi:N-acetylmuramoyl-L-alanine amidase
MTEPATDILARTIWGEARGCGASGMQHVAMVIMNRARNPRWWGQDVPTVCLAPSQFSCWLRSDPNLPKLKAVTDADPAFREALAIAESAMAGTLADETEDADSYWALSMPQPPAWAPRAAKTISDGWHQFCRVELPAPKSHPEAAPISWASTVPSYESPADRLNDAEEQLIKKDNT